MTAMGSFFLVCLALLPLTAESKCQYTGYPGSPGKAKRLRVCTTREAEMSMGNAAISCTRSLDIELPEGKEMTMADCENACSKRKECKGFIVRTPWNQLFNSKGNCFQIEEDALKADGTLDKQTTMTAEHKVTYVKNFCDCEAKYVHVQRWNRQSQWALRKEVKRNEVLVAEWRAQIDAEGVKLGALQQEQLAIASGRAPAQNQSGFAMRFVKMAVGSKQRTAAEVLTDIAKTQQQIQMFEAQEVSQKARVREAEARLAVEEAYLKRMLPMEQFDGVYQWFPPPPNFVKYAKLHKIRISSLFLSEDKEKALYMCHHYASNKTSRDKDGWYVTTKADLYAAAGLRSDQGLGELSRFALLKLYMSTDCVGRQFIQKPDPRRPEDWIVAGKGSKLCEVLPKSSREEPVCLPARLTSTWDVNNGCAKTLQDAAETRETMVIKQLNEECDAAGEGCLNGCPVSVGAASEEMQWAQWFVENPTAFRAALAALKLYEWGRGYDTKVRSLRQRDVGELLDRANKILTNLGPFLAALQLIDDINEHEAKTGEDDEWTKVACASTMLKSIQAMQGIFPKLAQNLAMRMDLIKDDYARDKMKETQSENPMIRVTKVEEYIEDEQASTLMLGGEPVPIFRFRQTPHPEHPDNEKLYGPPLDKGEGKGALKFKRLIAAGSVGQVLMYEVVDDRLTALLEEQGISSRYVMVKVVFEDTELAYTSDWKLLETILETAEAKGKLPPVGQSVWHFLKPMKQSIFDEFDLGIEEKSTLLGREMLADFSNMIRRGQIPGLPTTGIQFTTPWAHISSSKYVLLQSVAQGRTLKDHLLDAVSQPMTLMNFREKIYRGILHLYGLMAMKYGFFQADPHGGNWFIDDSGANTLVTLIDWGGVERWDIGTKCKLAAVYREMQTLTNRWDQCSSVRVETGSDFARILPSLAGTYVPAGVSIFEADEAAGMPALLMGFTVAFKYRKEGTRGEPDRMLHFDGSEWHISEPCLEQHCEKLYENLVTYDSRQFSKGADPRDPIETSQTKPKKRAKGGKWSLVTNATRGSPSVLKQVGASLSMGKTTSSLYLTRPAALQDCSPSENMASDLSLSVIQPQYMTKANELGFNPHPTPVLDEVLQVAFAAFDSDVIPPARIGLILYGYHEARKAARERGEEVEDPGMVPRIVPEYVLLLRCFAVFQGMLGDVLKSNIPPKLPKEYLEWFLDPSKDRLFKYWANYVDGCPAH